MEGIEKIDITDLETPGDITLLIKILADGLTYCGFEKEAKELVTRVYGTCPISFNSALQVCKDICHQTKGE